MQQRRKKVTQQTHTHISATLCMCWAFSACVGVPGGSDEYRVAAAASVSAEDTQRASGCRLCIGTPAGQQQSGGVFR